MTARKNYVRVTVVAPGPGDGQNWYLLMRGPGVRRRTSSGTTDRAEAERMAKEDEERANALLPPKRGEDPLVMTVYDRHVAFREADKLTARNTVLCYQAARGALAAAFAGARASGLSRAVLERAQRALLDTPLAPITANLYMQKLARAWKWAHGQEHSGVKAWPGVTGLPTERTEKRQYKPAELEAVLVEATRYAEGRFVPLFCLLAEVGGRIGEMCALRGRDVDRATGVVTFTTTKTRRRRRTRTIAISPEVLAMLPERRPDEWVFRSVRDPSKPLPDRTVTSAMWTVLERAGLGGEPLDLHSFRRYAVRKFHSAGVPVKDAMDFFGHERVSTFMGYMTDLSTPEAQRAMLEKAREQHDPLSALRVGSVSGRPSSRRKLLSRKAEHTCSGSGSERHQSGQPSRSGRKVRDGSWDGSARGEVVELSRDPRSPRLAAFMLALAPANLALFLEVAQDLPSEGLAAAAIEVAREHFPGLVREKPAAKKRAKRSS